MKIFLISVKRLSKKLIDGVNFLGRKQPTFKLYNQHHIMLLPPGLVDLVPKTHLAKVIKRLILIHKTQSENQRIFQLSSADASKSACLH